MQLSTAQVDTTFLAWWRKMGSQPTSISRALQKTREQIGPPMPANYVPPPWRGRAPSLKEMAKNNPNLSFLVWEPSDGSRMNLHRSHKN